MNKQEKISEWMQARFIKLSFNAFETIRDKGIHSEEYPRLFYGALKDVLAYLHSQGVVIRVEGELPENPFFGGKPSEGKLTKWYGANAYAKLIKQAGYTAVEPLVGSIIRKTSEVGASTIKEE